MTQPKSPFLVFQNFLTSSECEKLADDVYVETLYDDHGKPTPSERTHEPVETIIFQKLKLKG